jgi:ABC-type transport system involved in multi-copper enzyme maturation permease subunit
MMKLSLAAASLLLFTISLLILVLLTTFDSSLPEMSLDVERAISALFLLLPVLIGLALGILSLFRRDGKRWLAVLGILLNGLFACFHAFLPSFAG